jgi:hypothetical protein
VDARNLLDRPLHTRHARGETAGSGERGAESGDARWAGREQQAWRRALTSDVGSSPIAAPPTLCVEENSSAQIHGPPDWNVFVRVRFRVTLTGRAGDGRLHRGVGL